MTPQTNIVYHAIQYANSVMPGKYKGIELRAGTLESSKPRKEGRQPPVCRATQVPPAWNLLTDGQAVALDCDFQNFKHKDNEKFSHRIGRVAVVITNGETILDVYARYPFDQDYDVAVPPPIFDVTWRDLWKDAGAGKAEVPERWIKEIVTGSALIMHAGNNNMGAFYLLDRIFDGCTTIQDTQRLYNDRYARNPGLQDLARWSSHESIQQGRHSPVEDAPATMKLFKLKMEEETEQQGQTIDERNRVQKGQDEEVTEEEGQGEEVAKEPATCADSGW